MLEVGIVRRLERLRGGARVRGLAVLPLWRDDPAGRVDGHQHKGRSHARVPMPADK